MKGVGFFCGGLLLETLGFRGALWLMAGVLACHSRRCGAEPATHAGPGEGVEILPGIVRQIPRHQPDGGRAVFPVRLAGCLVRGGPARVSLQPGLALPRGGRISRELDHWLRPCAGHRALGHPPQRGRLVARGAGGPAVGRGADRDSAWCSPSCCSNAPLERPDLVITVGLGVFGFVFAVISSLHSYLILAYAGSEKAAEDVGFYYAANAGGRLIGILLSGALAQAGGMAACLWGSGAMLALCLVITFLLPVRGFGTRSAGHNVLTAVAKLTITDCYLPSWSMIGTVATAPHVSQRR